MNTKAARHLSEDRLIRALADEDSLDFEERDHLRSCPICLDLQKGLERSLSTMTRSASALTPPMRRCPTLPSRAAVRSPMSILGFTLPSLRLNPWMIGGAVAVALMAAFGGILSKQAQERQLAKINQEILEDARFLKELSQLEENSLPELCSVFSKETESADEDFLDFVVPDTDGETTSQTPAGGPLC